MLVNAQNLDGLRVGYSTAFQSGLGQANSMFDRITTEIRSTQKSQKYGWLGKMPNVREWIGARAVQNLQQHDYTIEEKPWELTIGVDRDDIETDNLGIYTPMFTQLGLSAGSKKDLLAFGLLKSGWSNECYDRQNYFDTDHPVLDEDGNETTVANTDGGSGEPWFLMDVSQALRPVIMQTRRDFEFVAKDNLTDTNVFMNKEFVYGTDARLNTGFGFWQYCWGSRQVLDQDTYAKARAALTSMKGDYGRPLGIMPRLLVVGPTMESRARKILMNDMGAGGETNEWKGTAELLVAPWLA